MCRYKADVLINGQNKSVKGYIRGTSILEGYSRLINVFNGCTWDIRDIKVLSNNQ